jgi:four helix bundle protein
MNYKKLEAWKQSMELVKDIYVLVKEYPKDEMYALTSQTKRAAVSIPANIAEGSGRNYKKDTIQFLHIARGSVYELETLLNVAVMVLALPESRFQPIFDKTQSCAKIINGLITYYEKSDLK